MGWIVAPNSPDSYVEALTPGTSDVTLFADRIPTEAITLKSGHKSEP